MNNDEREQQKLWNSGDSTMLASIAKQPTTAKW